MTLTEQSWQACWQDFLTDYYYRFLVLVERGIEWDGVG